MNHTQTSNTYTQVIVLKTLHVYILLFILVECVCFFSLHDIVNKRFFYFFLLLPHRLHLCGFWTFIRICVCVCVCGCLLVHTPMLLLLRNAGVKCKLRETIQKCTWIHYKSERNLFVFLWKLHATMPVICQRICGNNRRWKEKMVNF